jgi:acyl-CoA thioesterase-2
VPALADLLAVLELRDAGDGRFEADSVDEGHGVVFGGQLLAQAVVAASRSVTGKELLSLQMSFARGASAAAPIEMATEVLQDGRAFANLTITASQGGKVCTRAAALLHDPSPDLIRHGRSIPAVTPPDELPAREGAAGWWDIRIVGGVDISDPAAVGPAELQVWSRFPSATGDHVTAEALLAYASDGFLIGTAMRPHAGFGQSMAHVSISTTVLNQNLTFHERFEPDEWLLLDHRSTYAGRGRSYGTAEVFTADGRLVATYTQVNMIRDYPQGAAPAAGERSKF